VRVPERQHESRPSGEIFAFAVLLPLVVTFMMPYLVWVAVRDDGYGRRVAAWWVSLAVVGCGLVAVLAGSWWWLPVASFGVAVLAISHIGIRIWKDKRVEARSYQNDPEWVSNRR
jgi:hypothetical protein